MYKMKVRLWSRSSISCGIETFYTNCDSDKINSSLQEHEKSSSYRYEIESVKRIGGNVLTEFPIKSEEK